MQDYQYSSCFPIAVLYCLYMPSDESDISKALLFGQPCNMHLVQMFGGRWQCGSSGYIHPTLSQPRSATSLFFLFHSTIPRTLSHLHQTCPAEKSKPYNVRFVPRLVVALFISATAKRLFEGLYLSMHISLFTRSLDSRGGVRHGSNHGIYKRILVIPRTRSRSGLGKF